jgi:hypothetical protein
MLIISKETIIPNLIIISSKLSPKTFSQVAPNGDGMLRAALGIASLSAVTNLIGIANLSSCASLPPEIYRMLATVVFQFDLFLKYANSGFVRQIITAS